MEQQPGVWADNFAGVWHLGKGNGISTADSSGAGYNGTTTGNPAGVTGKIGTGAGFDGNSSIEALNTPALLTAVSTVSAWAKTSVTTGGPIYASGNLSANAGSYGPQLMFLGSELAYAVTGFTWLWPVAQSNYSDNQWHFVVGTCGPAGSASLYVDGQFKMTTNVACTPDQPWATIARNGGLHFTGAVDEVNAATVVRSGDWIATQYNNQNSPATFYTMGPAMSFGPSMTGLSTAIGPPGTAVTISGMNFGANPTGNAVTFNGTAATSSAWSNTSITVTVPGTATNGNVIVTAGGIASNGIAFTVTGAVATPTFSPAGGTYTATQNVAISSTTPGAIIRFTTDGSTPSETAGVVYTGPVAVSASATLKAIGYEANWNDSVVGSASYTITGTVATPTFSPVPGTYTTAQTIGIGSSTPGATIRYTTDGTAPTASNGSIYSTAIPLPLNSDTTLKAIAYKSTWADSAVAAGVFTITGTVATPTFSLAAGTYSSAQSLTLSTATPGATIRYTTDGSTPSASAGIVYSSAISLPSSTTVTVRAIAYEEGWIDSGIAAAAYVVTGTVAAPGFNPGAGTYTAGQTVTLSSATSGATIRYTTDGSAPTKTTGMLYAGAITVSGPVTLRAIAYLDTWLDSGVTSAAYVTQVAAPTFTPGAATYTAAQNVAMASTTPGAAIRYTTDGSTPTATAGVVYAGPVTVGATETVKAVAYLSGWADSAVASGNYTITGTVSAPSFTPAGGSYAAGQTVTLASSTPGASIRYTTDGSAPSASSGTVYAGPIAVTGPVTMRAMAYEAGWIDSGISSAGYVVPVATPTFSPAGGNYGAVQTVTIGTATPDAAIRYTTDGSTPSGTVGTIYAGPVTVSSNQTLRAAASLSGWNDSAVATAAYTMTVSAPSFTPGAGNYNAGQTVTLSTSTAGAAIRYTLDGSAPSETVGTVYTSPISLSAPVTVKAIGYEAGWTCSAVVSAGYSLAVATPSISPAGGTYTTAQTVTISTPTVGATIRYTTDGSAPSETTGTIYSAPFTVSSTATVKAMAYASGWVDSVIAPANYTITGTVSTPTFTPAAGSYTSVQTVTIASATPGAAVRYTIDGSTPSLVTGSLYTSPVIVGISQNLKAIAYEAGWNDSAIASSAYSLTVAPPGFSPAPGAYTTAPAVSITSSTPGASIRYTTDGSTPTSSSGMLYSAPILIGGNTTVKALAFFNGWNDSTVTAANYVTAQLTNTTLSPLATGTVSAAYSQPLSAAGGAPPYTWSVFAGSTLPPGLALSGNLVSGIPSAGGSFPFTLQVTDQLGATAFASLAMFVALPETITAPTVYGTGAGTPGSSYAYTAGDAVSSYGHTVQYQFTWGDGTTSGWLSAGAAAASKGWNSAGTYAVTVQARCTLDTGIVSAISPTMTVSITPSLNSFTVSSTVASGGSATITAALGSAAPAGGASVTLTSSDPAVFSVPASIAIAAGQTVGAATVIAGNASTPTPVIVTAVYNGTQTATVTVTPAPDFTLAMSPYPLTALQVGGSITYKITATGLNGFNQPINLTLADNFDPRFAMPLEFPSSYPSSILPNATASVLVTALYPGDHPLHLHGFAGGISHDAYTELYIPVFSSFYVELAPASSTSTTSSYSISVMAASVFSGTVSFSIGAPSCAATTVNPVAVSIPTGSTGPVPSAFTLDISRCFGGTYPVTVIASGGGFTSNASAQLSVSGPASSLQTITSVPAGLSVIVDGLQYLTPQAFQWNAGTTHSVALDSSQTSLVGTKYVFAGWSDGGASTHNVLAGALPITLAANFNTQYQLTTAVSPNGGGTISVTPSSSDGWYTLGTQLIISATANTGYRFTGFTGLNGVASPQTLIVAGPTALTANFILYSDLTQMAIWSLFVDRHELLVGANGSTGPNGGLYDLSSSDLATVNSLTDAANQQLLQLQAQVGSLDGPTYLSQKNTILQGLNTQLHSQLAQPSTIDTYTSSFLKARTASAPACDKAQNDCGFMHSEINFYNGGGSDYGLGAYSRSFVEGANAGSYSASVTLVKESYSPLLNPPATDNSWTEVDIGSTRSDTENGAKGAEIPHTEKNPKRGTYKIESFHGFTLSTSTQHVVYPPFDNPDFGDPPTYPATDYFIDSNGYEVYQTSVDLQFQVGPERCSAGGIGVCYANTQTAPVRACSSPITIQAILTPPLPAGTGAPPITWWIGGTKVTNNQTPVLTLPCQVGSSTVKAAIGAYLQTTVTVNVQPTVTVDKNKIVTGAGSQSVVTAASSIPANGTYSWEILATQSGDNPAIAFLPPSPPTCSGQPQCAITLSAGATGGKATLRAHFKVGTSDVTADTRVIVVQITNVSVMIGATVGSDMTISFPNTIPLGGIQWTSDLWSSPATVVLLRNSLPSIDVQAFTTPVLTDLDVFGTIAFDIRRSPDDNASIPGFPNVPTLQQSTSVGGTALALDQTGSFQFLAFVDANGNGVWDVGETGISLPIVLVQVSLSQNQSRSPSNIATYARLVQNGAWSLSSVAVGFPSLCPNIDPTYCAVDLKAEVSLIGGGNDGIRGTAQIFGGWVQNLDAPDVIGYYQNNHLDSWVFASNIQATASYATNHNLSVFLPGDPDPEIIVGPVIDTFRSAPGQGGDSSNMGNVLLTASAIQPTLGRRVVVEDFDATLAAFPDTHDFYTTSTLTQIRYNLRFRSFLTLWSSMAGVSGPTGAVADRTYVVLLQQPWSIASGFAVDAHGNGSPFSMSAVTLDPTAATVYPVGPATVSGVVLTQCAAVTPCRASDVTAQNEKH